MEHITEILRQGFEEYGLTDKIDPWAITSLDEYCQRLLEKNQVMNLTAIRDPEGVARMHFLDCTALLKFCSLEGKTLIDVGTGAGFPGMVLKILVPSLKVTLLDSLHKRIQFLRAVTEELELENVITVHGRAEDFAKQGQLRERFDLCVSRAVANFSTLSEYCLPFVKKGGVFVAYKSEKASDEFRSAGKAIQILGGKLEKKREFTLPDSDIYRSLYVIRKEKATPGKYPRKAGLPGKEPL